MKTCNACLLAALIVGTFFTAVQHSNAQSGGTKPELVMYRFNGGPGGSPAPVVAGDLVGTLRWRGLTAIGSIRSGASIESVAKQVSPGFISANLVFRTTTAATTPFEPIPRMIITETGRVGIDEMDPQYNLHVKGNTHTTGNFYGRIHFDKNQTTNAAPNSYIDEAYFELKDRSVLTGGLALPATSGTQGGVLTLGPGGTAFDHQLFFGETGIWSRYKTGNAGDWSAANWNKLLSAADISGTPNRLARFLPPNDPSSTLGNSQLYDNGVNVVVGGSAAPFTAAPAFNAAYALTVNGLSGNAASVNGNARVDGLLSLNNTAPNDALVVNGTSTYWGNAVFNGNVGLGTAPSATDRLDVSGSTLLRNNAQINGNLGLGSAPSATDRLEVSGTAHFSGQTRVDGKLLVGSPVLPVQGNHELYVNGSIIAEEIKVELQGNWPDYVFETNYPLMPLAEVEEFVQVHKHLPGVPSMSEIAQEGGFELGDMNRRLLEKVEELTLYLFEQQKQIDVLQKEINDLKK
ncbi:MAG: hypothetical protein ACOYNO_14515 [Saprospiraceae bacterium]